MHTEEDLLRPNSTLAIIYGYTLHSDIQPIGSCQSLSLTCSKAKNLSADSGAILTTLTPFPRHSDRTPPSLSIWRNPDASVSFWFCNDDTYTETNSISCDTTGLPSNAVCQVTVVGYTNSVHVYTPGRISWVCLEELWTFLTLRMRVCACDVR